MDNMRMILFALLALVGFQLYLAWQQDYGHDPKKDQSSISTPEQGRTPDTDTSVPSISTTNENTALPQTPSLPKTIDKSRLIDVETDVLSLKIDALGGTVVEAVMKTMPVSLEEPENLIKLLTTAPEKYYVAQSGLIGQNAPVHNKARYQTKQGSYSMSADTEDLEVILKWQNDAVEVSKHFRFKRGSYKIEVEHQVKNISAKTWTGRQYQQLLRTGYIEDTGSFFMPASYTGGAYYAVEDRFQKYDFEDMRNANLDLKTKGGWVSILQHYFTLAWVGEQQLDNTLYTKTQPNNRYLIGLYSPAKNIAPGATEHFQSTLYVGPKLNKQLKATAEGMELTRDYGWLAFLAKPMYMVLEFIHDYVGNWGWTIILFTILLKLLFYKLSETSYRSMARMKKFAPRMQAMKDRYGDDKQRMQQAMMELYKKEKVNPLGGCLPMLVQIPFFIALYWVLMESVELRQAPWMLWINDLSIMDPYFILPLIMGGSMFLQQKLNPAPPDPMQARIMQMLPIIFTLFFAFFPAGLVLYWVVNNVLSIAQQYVITKRIEAEG